MIANSQGAEKLLCPTPTQCLEQEVRHMEGVEYQDPHAHDFPLGGMSARQYASVRLPKAFPDHKSATHDPVLTVATAMNNVPDNHVLEDINVESPVRHSRAHDPNSFSYSDGSAKKVDDSRLGNGPERGRQDPECKIQPRCARSSPTKTRPHKPMLAEWTREILSLSLWIFRISPIKRDIHASMDLGIIYQPFSYTEAAGTFTGTGLIMAHGQAVLRIDPRGRNTTNTINRVELVGGQAWLKLVSQLELPTCKCLQAAHRYLID